MEGPIRVHNHASDGMPPYISVSYNGEWVADLSSHTLARMSGKWKLIHLVDGIRTFDDGYVVVAQAKQSLLDRLLMRSGRFMTAMYVISGGNEYFIRITIGNDEWERYGTFG